MFLKTRLRIIAATTERMYNSFNPQGPKRRQIISSSPHPIGFKALHQSLQGPNQPLHLNAATIKINSDCQGLQFWW
ncbi:hypothetical protein C8Q75DRAFT_139463 [Abortiporus biennis]|nr:hypothetical protein C8Q75DRAFT_139463 [Abortiporus biennis]